MRKGLTLIELLIAIAVMVVVATMGAFISLNSVKQRAVINTAAKLRSVLALARDNSLAGKKVKCPTTDTLAGWQIRFNLSSYSLEEVCKSSGSQVYTTYSTPGVSLTSSVNPIIFQVLTGGVNTGTSNDATIDVSGIITEEITVSSSGEIQ